ncbi:Adaptive-response sensory-kinase SasA [Dyadobacter sp. CECT 9275]|uniref:histidine kinase n=1 Tax=Dyadobacter helix TaxID=2822344 RepID=A0A916NLF3_9BACT|nr:PAS domain-containing sensor histidine kinase [Dyadobacter sp. CECT 9275]CAG5000441.1 Adaptive-response sensory-kinase SasA [Dyadobacter sp. CECT 9275]
MHHYNKELFFQISPDFLCIAGYDGYFKQVNPAFSKLLGYTHKELLARPIDEFVYPEDRNLTSQYREHLKSDNPLLNYENRYVTKSGEIIWLSWTSVPRYSEKLVYAIAKNITHIKIQEKDRNTLITNLTKVNHDLKQLTYKTSHDLRSPVSNLLSVFDLLDTSKIKDAETLEFLSILRSAAENLKDTLNSYVDALVQKDLLTVPVEVVSFSRSLQVALHSLKSLIENSKAEFRTDFSEVDEVRFNESYMESIFLNLITNAIKYVIAGRTPVISIVSRKWNDVTQLIFSDQGMGFDLEQVKDKIFRLNQTFHNHADAKGIGLYLVHNQITSLGGNIVLESRPNQGARFTLSFKR